MKAETQNKPTISTVLDQLSAVIEQDIKLNNELLKTIANQNFVKQINEEISSEKTKVNSEPQTKILNIQSLVNDLVKYDLYFQFNSEAFSQIPQAESSVDQITRAWQTINRLREEILKMNQESDYFSCRQAFLDMIIAMIALNELFDNLKSLLSNLKKEEEEKASLPPQQVEKPIQQAVAPAIEIKPIVEKKEEPVVVAPKPVSLPNITISYIPRYSPDEFLFDYIGKVENIFLPDNETKFKVFLATQPNLARIWSRLFDIKNNLEAMKPKIQEEAKLDALEQALVLLEHKKRIIQNLARFAATHSIEVEREGIPLEPETTQAEEMRTPKPPTKPVEPPNQTKSETDTQKIAAKVETVSIKQESTPSQTQPSDLKYFIAFDTCLGKIKDSLRILIRECYKPVSSAKDLSNRLQAVNELDEMVKKLKAKYPDIEFQSVKEVVEDINQLRHIYQEVDDLKHASCQEIDQFILNKIGPDGTKKEYLKWLSFLVNIDILNGDKKQDFAAYLIRNKDSHLLAVERHFFRRNSHSIQTRSMHKAMALLIGDNIQDENNQPIKDGKIDILELKIKSAGAEETHVFSRHSIRAR